MPFIKLLVVLVVQLVAGATAQISSSPVLTINGCVDSPGFATCQQNANDIANTCLNNAKANGNTQVQIEACICAYYTQNINCAAAYCWNRVNECNYQNYVISYLWNCPIARMPIPYFPFEDGAPDSCSCNVGKVFISMTYLAQVATTCSNTPKGNDPVGYIQGCTCCRLTGDISRYFPSSPVLFEILPLPALLTMPPAHLASGACAQTQIPC